MNEQHDLETVIQSRFPIITVETLEEARVVELIKRSCLRNEWPMYKWDVVDGLERGDRFNDREAETHEPDQLLKHLSSSPQNGIFVLLDFCPYLNDDPVRQRAFKRIAQNHSVRNRTIILVGHEIELPPDLKRLSASFELAVPDLDAIRRIIKEEVESWKLISSDPLRGSQEALDLICRHLVGLCEEDVRRLVRQSLHDDGALTMDDVERIQKVKYDMLDGTNLLSLELDTGKMGDVGGFFALKRWLELRKAPFLGVVPTPGLAAPKGVLLLGVQGAGKSLAAKCVAGTWGVPLLRMDFGALYNKFFGETERNTRAALNAADAMAPCVLWMDEIEKGLSSASNSMDGGVSRRVLGTLLTWMSERSSRVFLIATANDISALPPELMRKGRFDEIFFVDLPDSSTRAEIFKIHLRRREYNHADFDLEQLAQATEGYSGSEIEQAIVSALYDAFNQQKRLQTDHVLDELGRTRPLSVVMAERVDSLRSWAAERAVPAN